MRTETMLVAGVVVGAVLLIMFAQSQFSYCQKIRQKTLDCVLQIR